MLVANLYLLIFRVSIGSPEHLIPILIFIVAGVAVIYLAQNYLPIYLRWRLVHIIAIIISVVIASYHIYRISLGNYSIKTDLPLYLCSLLALFIPLFTYFKNYLTFEILYFWIVGGTIQGVITPDIAQGYPSFDYFRYWTVHLGLLIVIFYVVFVFKWKPTFKSIFKSFIALQVYIALMLLINHILNSNYFYLNEKPKSATLIDHLGDWPWYLLVVELMIIPYFILIFLPFLFLNKSKPTSQKSG